MVTVGAATRQWCCPTRDCTVFAPEPYAVKQRPVVLLVDSVRSHISMSVFEASKNKGIEL